MHAGLHTHVRVHVHVHAYIRTDIHETALEIFFQKKWVFAPHGKEAREAPSPSDRVQ